MSGSAMTKLIEDDPADCPTCHNFSMPMQSKYLVPSTGKRVTLSQLKHLKKEFQIEAMRRWFSDNYDAPDELPYDSSEGGYQWIWGGPYDAEEALQDAFGGAIDDETIEDLASDLSDISGESAELDVQGRSA